MEGVSSLELLSSMNTSNSFALHAAICRLGDLDAVWWHIGTADEVAADPAPPYGTGTLGATIVNKVGVSLGHLAILEASTDAVVVLVSLARTSFL